MRASKLVQLMKLNSATMTGALVQRIRTSRKCDELPRRVGDREQKQYAVEIFRDLIDFLGNEEDANLERRYVDLGFHRAGQGVPLFQMFWAVCIAREYLWEYVQQECLQEDPVEFWGGVTLLRSLNVFFDRVLYFALVGYQRAEKDEAAAMTFLVGRRSA